MLLLQIFLMGINMMKPLAKLLDWYITKTWLGILNLERHFLNFTTYFRSCFLLMLIQYWMETLCVPCFVFGPVVFVVLWGMALCAISSSASIIPRNGNWFLYLNCILLLCVYVFV